MAQIGIVRSALRATGSTEGGRVPTTRARELAWTIIPAAGLALVLFLTWREMNDVAEPEAIHHHSSTAAS